MAVNPRVLYKQIIYNACMLATSCTIDRSSQYTRVLFVLRFCSNIVSLDVFRSRFNPSLR